MMNKIKTILSSKKGVSLVFVLCVTLLLMSISTSVLVAVSTAASSDNDQWDYEQLNIYSDSVTKFITYSLQKDEELININNPQYLGGKLVREIYDAADPDVAGGRYPDTLKINFSPYSGGDFFGSDYPSGAVISDAELRFPVKNIVIEPEIPASPAIVDGAGNVIFPSTERIPKKCFIDVEMTAKFKVEYKGETVTTFLRFELLGAELDDAVTSGIMAIKNTGEWRLIGNEKIKSI